MRHLLPLWKGGRAVMLRKWWILLFAFLVGGLVSWARFTDQARVSEHRHGADRSKQGQSHQCRRCVQGMTGTREYFQTQAESIKSRDIALRVINKLNLLAHPEFDPRQGKAFFAEDWVKENAAWGCITCRRSATPKVTQNYRRWYCATLRSDWVWSLCDCHNWSGSASRRTIRNWRPVSLTEVAQAFINADIDARFKITQSAGSMLNERWPNSRPKPMRRSAQCMTYREREGIIDTKGSPLSGESKRMDDLTLKWSKRECVVPKAEEHLTL